MTVKLPARHELAPQETWALDHIFVSGARAAEALADLERRVAALVDRAGRLVDGAAALLATLDELDALVAARECASVYFRLPVFADQGDATARAAAGRFSAMETAWASQLAFLEPELLTVSPERMAAMLVEAPGLSRYAAYLAGLEERRPHVRGPEVEDLLAGAAGVFEAYELARDALAEGDLRFTPVQGSAGAQELAPSTQRQLIGDADREVRRQAFEHWTDGYLGVADTLAEIYLGRARRLAFEAGARRYASGEASALAGHRIPVEVLDATLVAFERRLPVWHRYWAARRRLLGVERHEPWDVFAPPPIEPVRVPYDQAADWIMESAAPLGRDYGARLRRGLLEGRWVDRCANRGKRQGAFCTFAPGVHPYVLLSYGDDLSSASILAHEMGHALHAELAHVRGPVLTPQLSMSVAETASNAQQALLRGYLLRGPAAADPDLELALIDEAFGNLHRYLFVMPTLVRFEREVHAAIDRNEPLSAVDLTARSAALFREAYGPDVSVDDRVGIAWAEFPHLYMPFYTFQYTVGVSVALAEVARIDAGEPAAAFLEFLAAGATVPPVEAFARLGFDVTTPAPVESAFDVVEGLVERLEHHVVRLGR